MSFYNNRNLRVEEFWKLPSVKLRELASYASTSTADKRLATGIANQKDGLSRAPSIKENRAKALNYMIFALKGQEGTLGAMGYRAAPGNTDLTSYEYHTIQAAIKNARDAVTAALHCVERISKAKSKKQQKKDEVFEKLIGSL